jgi:hypothetical protein
LSADRIVPASRTWISPEAVDQDAAMKILGPFLSVEDRDTFFFMRGFPDLASREPMKAKYYERDLWKRELEAVLMPMLDRYDVVVVEDPESQVRW